MLIRQETYQWTSCVEKYRNSR